MVYLFMEVGQKWEGLNGCGAAPLRLLLKRITGKQNEHPNKTYKKEFIRQAHKIRPQTRQR